MRQFCQTIHRLTRRYLPSQAWLPVAAFVVLSLLPLPPIQRLDLLVFDLISPDSSHDVEAPQAVVIAIDERSLAQLGPWPLPRQRYADLLDVLNAAGSGPVAFAIAYDTQDPARPQSDAAFAYALKQTPAALLPVIPVHRPDGLGLAALRPWEGFRKNVIEGHADVDIDIDGLSRRVYLFAGVDGTRWPALAFAALRAGPGDQPTLPVGRQFSDFAPQTGIWQRDREILIRHSPNAAKAIPVLSMVDVLNGRIARSQLQGKTIFVGVIASGLNAQLSIPGGLSGGTSLSAVEYHARVFEALRHGAAIAPLASGFALAFGCLMLLLSLALIGRRQDYLLPSFLLIPLLLAFLLARTFATWFAPTALFIATLLLVAQTLWDRFHQLEARERRIRQRSRVAMESIADGVVLIDGARRIELANSVACDLTGQSLDRMVGRATQDVFAGSSVLIDAIERCLDERIKIEPEEPIRLEGLSQRVVRVSLGPVTDGPGGERGAVLVMSDISQLMLAEERLQHQATHDPMTDLPNRALIQDRLNQVLAGLQRTGQRAAVLFVDLDRFKRINDGAGHQVGDQVLRIISQRFRSCCRQEDTVGRWGGDEFVIILAGNGSVEHCQTVANKLISETRKAIHVGEGSYHVGVSIGIALAPDDGNYPGKLLNLADLAMYHAKMAGGDRYVFASPELNRHSIERLETETGLRHAIDHGQFEIHYQPQFDALGNHLTGLEALIRWRRTADELVGPDHFIGVAEDSGLIVEIGAWVIDQVAAQISSWQRMGFTPVPVAVNISARQCQDLTLVDIIKHALEQHQVPAELFEIEITETAAVQNLETMRRLLDRLDTLGIRVAIDDFGTGYSSLAHLKCLPISVLKIDKSFIAGTPDNLENRSISKATIALAHSLGLKVVAEGVEEAVQRDFLQGERCDVVQGFFFSRPVPAAQIEALLGNPD